MQSILKTICLIFFIVLFFKTNLNGAETDNYSVIIGNSAVRYGIDSLQLNNESGTKIIHYTQPSEFTTWMFCAFWNSLKMNPKPKNIIIVLTHYHLITNPSKFNATTLDEQIGDDSRLKSIVDSILTLSKMIYNTADFNSSVQYTFLPTLIKTAKDSSVNLIFLNHRSSHNYTLESFLPPNDAITEKYRNEIADYLNQYKIPYLDYSLNPSLSEKHYLVDGFHHNYIGKKVWTSIVAADLKAIFSNQPSKNDISTISKSDSVIITMPSPKTSIACGNRYSVSFSTSGKLLVYWSIYDDKSKEYLVDTLPDTYLNIPQIDTTVKSISLIATSGRKKYIYKYELQSNSTMNTPPLVNAGNDLIFHKLDTLSIVPVVSDDSTPNDKLTYKWEIIYGDAYISNTNQPSVQVSNKSSRVVIRISVSDGVLSSYDDVEILRTDDDIVISKFPSYTMNPGDTISINWISRNVTLIYIWVSFNGKNWIKLNADAFNSSDPEWGSFKWIIPLSPPSNSMTFKVTNYDETKAAFTSAVEIKTISIKTNKLTSTHKSDFPVLMYDLQGRFLFSQNEAEYLTNCNKSSKVYISIQKSNLSNSNKSKLLVKLYSK